jgi:tetratricopeptide (TPR) repeat protein
MTKARPRLVLLILFLACAADAYGQAAGGAGLHRLSWPGKNWSLDVSLAPFTILMEDSLRNGAGYFTIAGLNNDDPLPVNTLMLTVRMEAAKVKGTDADLRDAALKRLKNSGGLEGGSVKAFEYKQIPALKYSHSNTQVQPYFPYPIKHGSSSRGVEAFFVKDDVWITFSLNALSLKKADEGLFYALLDSVKFTDTSTPSSSFDYLYRGIAHIRQKQYKEAAEQLNLALGLEQKQRQLDNANWRNLIGHLLDIYTAVGDKARVKELLDYGIGHDPTFPLFHLSLAIHHASVGDMDNTIASLEKAYLHRKNDRRTAGFSWVDPLTLPAFEAFWKNEKFRKAAKAMKR